MSRILEKVERRLGEKLFLKAHRCMSPKCATVKRGYPPGMHGKKKRRRGHSEYGELLHEKQVVRFLYGLDDKDLKRYAKEASEKGGSFVSRLLQMLEQRLDNAVFRLGFAESRRIARQMISHGHITINGRTVTIPSYRIKNGEIIALKERSLASGLFEGLDTRLKKYNPPQWLSLNPGKKSGQVIRAPEPDDAGLTANLIKVKEFYSR